MIQWIRKILFSNVTFNFSEVSLFVRLGRYMQFKYRVRTDLTINWIYYWLTRIFSSNLDSLFKLHHSSYNRILMRQHVELTVLKQMNENNRKLKLITAQQFSVNKYVITAGEFSPIYKKRWWDIRESLVVIFSSEKLTN